MLIDVNGYHSSVDSAGTAARAAEAAGYDGWWATETQIDPFLGLSLIHI